MSITSLLPHQGDSRCSARHFVLKLSCLWMSRAASLSFRPLVTLEGAFGCWDVCWIRRERERVGGRVNLSMLVRSLDIRKYLFEYKHQKNITHVSCQIHIAFSVFSSHWFQRGVGFFVGLESLSPLVGLGAMCVWRGKCWITSVTIPLKIWCWMMENHSQFNTRHAVIKILKFCKKNKEHFDVGKKGSARVEDKQMDLKHENK